MESCAKWVPAGDAWHSAHIPDVPTFASCTQFGVPQDKEDMEGLESIQRKEWS